ncbi:hypothetical protein [Moorena sp. SIO4G3]|uniref:hypothetical protein n=1 Tax=Moorena sp. SIO4G3 TaxID=2607821 RepID=UPI00142C40AB|nr:hypothetical protein [Moorena sp. SIO4G3]NEO78268.1 hypothetical protein [Moorena sp. SIO4G3]
MTILGLSEIPAILVIMGLTKGHAKRCSVRAATRSRNAIAFNSIPYSLQILPP